MVSLVKLIIEHETLIFLDQTEQKVEQTQMENIDWGEQSPIAQRPSSKDNWPTQTPHQRRAELRNHIIPRDGTTQIDRDAGKSPSSVSSMPLYTETRDCRQSQGT